MPQITLAKPMAHSRPDPTPLTRAQVGALFGSATRELSWGLREVTRETRAWRALAELIPDGPIRDDALASLERKRGHADGAALFSVLSDGRDGELIGLLVAYETILDFLDNVSERHASLSNGRELHLALVEALEPDLPMSDYYRHHPWHDDHGYLEALVEFCRHRCRSLPSYERVRPLLVQTARRMQVLALNHLRDPARRDASLREWVDRELPDDGDMHWYELTAAASASLAILALLALANEADVCDREIVETYAVYWPWVSLAATMLDSYVDQHEDREAGDHSYISHYPTSDIAVQRVGECIGRSAGGVSKLRHGHRHAVIVSCMVAMYLSKDSARAPGMGSGTRCLVRAGGSLAQVLLPALRVWRIVYSQRSA
jgi:tetraprenyl-beta-curcumene synthase